MKALVWLKNSLKSYWSDEEGQTTLEYILLLVVVVAIIMKFKSKVTSSIDPMMEDIFDNKVKDLMK